MKEYSLESQRQILRLPFFLNSMYLSNGEDNILYVLYFRE
jgi:hypothetical protein